ncbi:nmrA-like family domain-containing protein 1 [Saccoglossus kowalevskii]|uniref:NmrA-like family domain-containing protein 1 n=1 Tax=Saccoglossus kowalevskii TaxID=10224 RepID=A0ABM0GT12_SACKO|nr:PREDICTED: nmrA-like family domain-containing protein 1-like [Saccoglossus kowalevskii]
MAKLVAVFGATGIQGGSVARALLKNPIYKVRAVTRNLDSSKAEKLKESGAEVVKADLDDKSSIDAALTGCYGVFGVTNYWEYLDKSREIQQGRNLADAAKNAGVKHVVFSGLENVKSLFGKACDHFDGKWEIEEYMAEIGLPYTSVRYSKYVENILGTLKPIKGPDGVYYLGIPVRDQPIHIISAGEAGVAIVSVFDNPSDYIGKRIGLSGDFCTVAEMAKVLTRHLSPLQFKPGNMTCEQFASLDFPGADDLAVMFEFYQSGKMVRDIELTRKLDPNTKTWEQWVVANRDQLMAIFK